MDVEYGDGDGIPSPRYPRSPGGAAHDAKLEEPLDGAEDEEGQSEDGSEGGERPAPKSQRFPMEHTG